VTSPPAARGVQCMGLPYVRVQSFPNNFLQSVLQFINYQVSAYPSYFQVAVDQLVAAPFMYDKKFYRAQVTDVNKSGEGMEGTTLGLYYVDYGDSGVAPLSETFALRTDYLKLRFQAIECILARVKPR